jgi:hypothetical protein
VRNGLRSIGPAPRSRMMANNGKAPTNPVRNAHSKTRLSRRQIRKYAPQTRSSTVTGMRRRSESVHVELVVAVFRLLTHANVAYRQTGQVKINSPVACPSRVVPIAPSTKVTNAATVLKRPSNVRRCVSQLTMKPIARMTMHAASHCHNQRSLGTSNAYSGSTANRNPARSNHSCWLRSLVCNKVPVLSSSLGLPR